MNLVLDEAEEVHMKTKNRKTLGMFVMVMCMTNGKFVRYIWFRYSFGKN